jgi:hypothetical protein
MRIVGMLSVGARSVKLLRDAPARCYSTDMFCMHVIDNLGRLPGDLLDIDDDLAERLSAFIIENTVRENQTVGAYSPGELQNQLRNKRGSLIKARLADGLLVYLTDADGELAAIGMAVYRHARYELKTLHVNHDLRGRGLATIICDARDLLLAFHGAREIYIESLKFPRTLQFNLQRGFRETVDGKARSRSVLMSRQLTWPAGLRCVSALRCGP